MSMRKESGGITSDRKEILRICTDFYKSLYSQTMPSLKSAMKSSPDTNEVPKFTEDKVEMAIRRMNRRKSHRIFGITSDKTGRGEGGGGKCRYLPNKHLQYML